jgi:hypothetical protein
MTSGFSTALVTGGVALAAAVMVATPADAQERVHWKVQSAFPDNLSHLGTAGKQVEARRAPRPRPATPPPQRPSPTSISTASVRTSCTTRACPAALSRRVIGPPIWPRPTKPIGLVIAASTSTPGSIQGGQSPTYRR